MKYKILFLGMIANALYLIIISFISFIDWVKNPELTKMQIFLEYWPHYAIILAVSIVLKIIINK